ncbi:MAG: porin [Duodenibacillus sp.]|nr:porin [Duodenibacillus sp.]
MKKSLLAVAVLGAFAGSALAADVTLYGVVDTGLEYTYSKNKATNVKTHKFAEASGRQAGSRWGLKGVEDLGNGYSVGFILESGFNSDTGMGNTQLFNREASLSVSGPFGKLMAGRMGAVTQGTSSVGLLSRVNAFGTSYGTYVANASNILSAGAIRDNMLTYITPKFAGFQVYAQYAMGGEGIENKSNRTKKYAQDAKTGLYYSTTNVSADRYAALAATYENGPLNLLFAVDRIFYGHDAGVDMDDSLTVTFGGNYDFGVVKVFGAAQYFDEVALGDAGYNQSKLGTLSPTTGAFVEGTGTVDGAAYKVKGYALTVSASAPVAGGSLLASVGYKDAEQADSMKDTKFDFKRIRATVGYSYPLSKRTNVYAAAGFGQDKTEPKGGQTVKVNSATALFGLRHNF